MKNKSLSIILAFCMLFTVFSGIQITSYAENNTINWTDGTIVSEQTITGSNDAENPLVINVTGTVTIPHEISLYGYVKLTGGGTLVRSSSEGHMFIVNSEAHLTTDNITVCGNNISIYDARAFMVSGDLTINEGTTICHHYNSHTEGSAIYSYGGNVIMNGGLIEENSVQSYGTIYLDGYSDFTLNGGIIRNNKRTGTTQYGGGAIYVRYASLTINGGTITGHDVGSGYGGGIYCTSYGSVYLNGGIITGNKAYKGNDIFYSSQQGTAAQIHIGGEPKIGSMHLDNYYSDKYPYITSIIKNDVTLVVSTLEENRILAVGSDYTLTEADAQKITVMDQSGTQYFVKLDSESNTFVLTQTDPGYTQKYYVSYYANGGTGQTLDDTPYLSGETAEICACSFERYGYDFIGWNTAADGTGDSYNAGDKISVTSDLPLFAQWKKFETFSIGDTKYRTLQDAIDNAQDGDVLVLSGNMEGDGAVVPSGKNITINLNGYTYTVSGELVGSTGTKTLGFQLLKDSNITIKNGTLSAGNPDMKMFVQNYSDLTLEDVTLDCKDDDKIQYVLSNNNGDVQLIGNTNINANDASVAFDVYDYASAGYTGVKVSVNTTGIIDGKIEVSDGNATLAVSGGTFTYPLEDAWCAEGFEPKDNGDGTYSVKEIQYVANLNGTSYRSLADAVSAANDGDTIWMIDNDYITKDITIDKNLTLELEGYELSDITIKFSGNINVKINDRVGTAKLNTNKNAGYTILDDYPYDTRPRASFYLTNGANVSISGSSEGTEFYGGDGVGLDKAFVVGQGCKLTVDGGVMMYSGAAGSDGIFICDTGTLILKDIYINKYTTYTSGSSLSYATAPKDEYPLKIVKGHFIGGMWVEQRSTVNGVTVGYGRLSFEQIEKALLYTSPGSEIDYSRSTSSNGWIIYITGNLSTDDSMDNVVDSNDILRLSEGGLFKVELGQTVSIEPKVSGGDGTEFTYSWTKDGVVTDITTPTLLIENVTESDVGVYEFTATQSGKKVTTKYKLAITDEDMACFKIDETPYFSLQEAVDNAKDGDTITVIWDAEGDGIVIPSNKNIIIDLGGFTYTVSGELVGSTGTKTLGFQLLKDSNITIKNGTLSADNPDMKMFVQNYSDLTLEDVTLDCKDDDKIQYVLSNNNGDVQLIGNTNINANDASVAFDVYDYASAGYTGVKVSVNTTGIIDGKIEVSDGNATLAISGGTFTTPLENAWCEKGFVPVENSDGTYTVIRREIIIADNTVTVTGVTENAVLILASYEGDRLVDTKLVNVSNDTNISISETGLITKDSIKAMLVKDLLTLTPLCEANIITK